MESLHWGLHKEREMTASMLYAQLPESVQKMVETTFKTTKCSPVRAADKSSR